LPLFLKASQPSGIMTMVASKNFDVTLMLHKIRYYALLQEKCSWKKLFFV